MNMTFKNVYLLLLATGLLFFLFLVALINILF
jgi:hypothetical protein